MPRQVGSAFDYTPSDKKDDGGSAKGGSRLLRRRRRRIIDAISIPLGMITIIWILIQLQHHVSHRIEIKRTRNKALVKKMNNSFQEHDDDDLKTGQHVNHNGMASKYRWIDLRQLPPFENADEWYEKYLGGKMKDSKRSDFKIDYNNRKLFWEDLAEEAQDMPPTVDYTKRTYQYPDFIPIPPRGGSYPPLEPMENLFKRWPQEDIDSPPTPFVEKLQHFDFNDPEQMEAAVKYRDLEFPFKVYNIPEIDAAGEKWTDEYLTYHFDRPRASVRHGSSAQQKAKFGDMPPSNGKAQQSVDSFFAFFVSRNWNVKKMGAPPTMDTDLSFEKWSKHARYADAVGLEPNEQHYYWQSGVPPDERKEPKHTWTMISRDLPSFSDRFPNFFSFNPDEQKGIQCRFGERGVTAATHYDGGRNMVGMITGAKRYILSPPKECSKLGVVTKKKHPVYRHSLLNFGHINALDNTDDEISDMPSLEREWLNIAKNATSIDTVLKAGEVLYIPSHWFHYIISLQKSAQCNVRAGRHIQGSREFGGADDVKECVE